MIEPLPPHPDDTDRQYQPLTRQPNPAPLILAPTGDITTQVRTIQSLTAIPPTTAVRRILFMWLRIWVHESKPNGKQERVNIRVPLPIPLLGLLLPWRMNRSAAFALLADAHDNPATLQRALEGHMSFEFVHVDEFNPNTGRSTRVSIGLD